MLRIKLKEILARKKMTFKELADLSDLKIRWLSSFANDHITLLQTDKLVKLCKALNCNISDLIEIQRE